MTITLYPMAGFPKHTDNFTFTGSNWNGSYPVTNLQDIEYARVGRSTGTGVGSPDGTPVVIGTSNTPRTVQVFGIAAHKWRAPSC